MITMRHFSCSGCGKCCTRGPEMELTEATELANKFITRLIFRIHSLPLDTRKNRAVAWWKKSGSSLPMKRALDEARAHVMRFSARDKVDRDRKRTLHLTISALPVHQAKGACPALKAKHCSIYESRPLSCQSTPLHYSRPESELTGYLDRFTKTPGYECDTSSSAPIVFNGDRIDSDTLSAARNEGLSLSQRDRAWKHAIVSSMEGPTAAADGLPAYADVLHNSDAGGATTVSMSVAWGLAQRLGMMTSSKFKLACDGQLQLLRTETQQRDGADEQSEMFGTMLSDYESLCSVGL